MPDRYGTSSNPVKMAISQQSMPAMQGITILCGGFSRGFWGFRRSEFICVGITITGNVDLRGFTGFNRGRRGDVSGYQLTGFCTSQVGIGN